MPQSETDRSQRWRRWQVQGMLVIGSTLLGLAGLVLLVGLAKWLITGGDAVMADCITTQTRAGMTFDAAVKHCR